MATPLLTTNEQYPIGFPDRNSYVQNCPAHIEAIRAFPARFSSVYDGLQMQQLDTPYRTGGWTLRQLAHHVADSHMNAWVRTKLALTEDWPTIRPYDEKLWAETAEVRGPVEPSLLLLAALHGRWVSLLGSLTPEQWERGYVHPESGRATLAQVAALYGWHGRHHLAHASGLRERMGW